MGAMLPKSEAFHNSPQSADILSASGAARSFPKLVPSRTLFALRAQADRMSALLSNRCACQFDPGRSFVISFPFTL